MLALSAALLLWPCALSAQPTATNGYSVSVFAVGNDKYSAPDSIALANGHIFVGFGGPGAPDGSDGKSSYILEYTMKGALVHVYTHGGGYDDMVFRDHKLYLSCSNPANNPNAEPAIVKAEEKRDGLICMIYLR